MLSILLILPDFLIICTGYLLYKFFSRIYTEAFWKGAEKTVFYILFPPLLFVSVATSNLTFEEAKEFLGTAIFTMLCAVAMSYLLRYLIPSDNVTHASAFHCGFRFNTYIGFALVSRLYGEQGLALLSLLIAFWVPISNTIAVAALAKAVAEKEKLQHSSSVLFTTAKAILTTPLIIATILGLLCNFLQIKLPAVTVQFFRSLGSASLAMGLLCIGAGLHFLQIRTEWKLVLSNALERLVAVPIVAFSLAVIVGLPTPAAGTMIIFSMLPTAQSCYVMTASMRGNAQIVAGITTVQTLLSICTIPLWIFVLMELFHF